MRAGNKKTARGARDRRKRERESGGSSVARGVYTSDRETAVLPNHSSGCVHHYYQWHTYIFKQPVACDDPALPNLKISLLRLRRPSAAPIPRCAGRYSGCAAISLSCARHTSRTREKESKRARAGLPWKASSSSCFVEGAALRTTRTPSTPTTPRGKPIS